MARRTWMAVAGPALLLAASAAAQQVPRKLPDFSVKMVNAQPVSLSQYKGKPVVLVFILTTCPHCQHTVELLNKLQPAYAPRGLQVLASAVDDGPQNAVPLFVKYYHPVFPLGYNDGLSWLEFCGYSLDRLPHMPIMLFIDRQGRVREQHEGADEKFFGDQQEQQLRTAIDALLNPASNAPAKKKG